MNGVTANLTHVIRNGDADHSYAGCVNLSFAFVEGESLLMALKDVALSSGRWGHNSVLLHEDANTTYVGPFSSKHFYYTVSRKCAGEN